MPSTMERVSRAILIGAALLLGCPSPAPGDDDDATDDATPPDPGGFDVQPLRDPQRVAGAGFLVAPEGPGIDHVTKIAWDPEDRWLDDFAGGFAALDCDVDGDADLLFTSGDGEHTLHLNDGAASFTAVDPDAHGVRYPGEPTASAAVGDVDNDGDPDVLLLVQFANNRLLVNDGACVFEDRAVEYGLEDEHRSLHATWFDFDGDGRLDLYLTNWADAIPDDQPGVPAEPHPDRFWLRDDEGGFVEVTDQLPADTAEAYGMVTAFFDVDADGDYDLMQTNDRGSIFVGNRIFENLGPDDGGRLQWADVTVERGFVNEPDGMGLAYGDIDGDGDADIFNSGNYEALFVDSGDGYYYEAALASGLDELVPQTLSWGGSFFDQDADGDLDLIFVRSKFWDLGPEYPEQYEDDARFFRNTGGDPRFVAQALEGSPLAGQANWRAQAHVDLDGDGLQDVVVAVVEDGPRIALTNPPAGGKVVQVRLEGTRSNREGRGAVVRLGDQVRWPGVVEAYSTGTPVWPTFGLGDADEAGPLIVEWPSGAEQELASVPAGSVVTVTEPAAD